MSASPLFRGASRVLRSVPARSWSQRGGLVSLPSSAARGVSSLSVESQQKVRQEEPASVTSHESPRANQSTDTQLLATHLKEADPAMYEIIENASLQPRHPPPPLLSRSSR